MTSSSGFTRLSVFAVKIVFDHVPVIVESFVSTYSIKEVP